jgi:hypothetical protein
VFGKRVEKMGRLRISEAERSLVPFPHQNPRLDTRLAIQFTSSDNSAATAPSEQRETNHMAQSAQHGFDATSRPPSAGTALDYQAPHLGLDDAFFA